MILADFFRAVAQLGDRRFRRVLFLGLILTFALLAGVYALFLGAIQILTPDSLITLARKAAATGSRGGTMPPGGPADR